MAGATQPTAPPLSVATFRDFLSGRPDKERWELIDGVAVMMAPPTLAHQQIASNLQRLLHDALESHAPTLVVYQRAGVNVGPSVKYYDPEPDVVVVDADASHEPDRRYADRFYLAAEIVSSSDRTHVEKKRQIYKLHAACTCVLVVQQDRCEVGIDLRTAAGWTSEILKKPDDVLVLADFGLRCKVSDVYRGTALAPRPAPRSGPSPHK